MKTTEIKSGDVIAVGDIHGRLDLLDVFLESVRDTQATVILLGDLIDRGPDDLGVLERVEKLLEEPEAWGLEAAYALLGNHEQMYLDACEGYGVDIGSTMAAITWSSINCLCIATGFATCRSTWLWVTLCSLMQELGLESTRQKA